MENTCVSTWTLSNLRGDGTEKLGNSFFVLEVTEDYTTIVCRIIFRLGNEWLHIASKRFGLCHCSGDSLMEDKRIGHIGKKSLAMTALTSKMIDSFIVSHLYTFFLTTVILYFETSIPNDNFILSTRTSISLRDLRPKLRNFINSARE